jgi:hypothetical protein
MAIRVFGPIFTDVRPPAGRVNVVRPVAAMSCAADSEMVGTPLPTRLRRMYAKPTA